MLSSLKELGKGKEDGELIQTQEAGAFFTCPLGMTLSLNKTSDESLPHAENQIERMLQAMVWHICLHLDSKEAKHCIYLQITQGHREENQKQPRKNKQPPNTHLWEREGHPGQRTVLEPVLKSTQVSSQHPSRHTNTLGWLVLSAFQDSEEQAGNLERSRSSKRLIRSRGVQRQETVVLPRTQALPLSICRVNICACVCAKLFQSCPAPCDPMDCSPPGSSVYGILQAGRLEQVAMPSSRIFPTQGSYQCVLHRRQILCH